MATSTTPAANDIPEPNIPLPENYTLQQLTLNLAKGVLAAYTAYNNGSNDTPVLEGYGIITVINLVEAFPNTPIGGLLSAVTAADATSSAAPEVTGSAAPGAARPMLGAGRQLAAYAPVPGTDCVPTPTTGTPSGGNQLFGFSAVANDQSHNIVVLRGTVTIEEASYDMAGWGTNTACLLPSYPSQEADGPTQNPYGSVNSSLYSLYASLSDAEYYDPLEDYLTLGQSFKAAVAALAESNPGKPLYVAGHSLGGPMATLGALDASVSGSYGTNAPQPILFTFGGLSLGLQDFADAYATQLPEAGLRIANLCDFVPSMVSLEPVMPNEPYVHVGLPATFIWQTWNDWGNHSMQCVYKATVESHWDCLLYQYFPQVYPQLPPNKPLIIDTPSA